MDHRILSEEDRAHFLEGLKDYQELLKKEINQINSEIEKLEGNLKEKISRRNALNKYLEVSNDNS